MENTEQTNLIILSGVLTILFLVSLGFNILNYNSMENRLGLDDLYDDFEGNKDPDARMTATIDISTDKGDCSFDVLYEYDDYREIYSQGSDRELCDKYLYTKGKDINKEFLNRLLDEDYIARQY